MADIAGSSGNIIRPFRSPYGAPQVTWFEESTAASTAVVLRGDAVTFDTVVTTGGPRLVRAPSSGGNGANLMQVGVKSLVGVSLQTSTSDGGITGLNAAGDGYDRRRYLTVALATPETEFIGYASTLGANPIGNATLIGTNRPLIYDPNLHVFRVDSTNSTAANAAVHITDIPYDNRGDSGAFPVIFKFLSTNVSPVVGGGGQ